MLFCKERPLGLVVAVRDEVKDVLANPIFGWQSDGDDIYRSPLGVTLIIGHIGKANASFALGQIIDEVAEVFSVGTSGGLGQEQVGDIYISTEFVEHDMDASPLGFAKGVTPYSGMQDFVISFFNPDTLNRLNKVCTELGIEAKAGRTMSGDQFIASQEVIDEKIASFGVNLVDMESAALAKICLRKEKPFLALRYITDNANHDAHNDWMANVKDSSRKMNAILEKMLS